MAQVIDEQLQHREFGGFHFGAAFFGWLVAVGVSVLLTALLAAIGSAVAVTTFGNNVQNIVMGSGATVGWISGVLLLLAGAVSYYTGGYVAGRMARFDGASQGVGVWMVGLVASLVLGLAGVIFGASYNLLQQLNLPHIPISQGTLTAGGAVVLILGVFVTFFAAVLGGRKGEAYHRAIDRVGVVERAEVVEDELPVAHRSDPGFQPTFGETVDNRDVSDRSTSRRPRRYL